MSCSKPSSASDHQRRTTDDRGRIERRRRENFCCLSSMRCPLWLVFSESLCGPIRSIPANSAVGSAFAGLCAENFLHKLLGMLNASLRSGFVIARASRARRTLCNRANIERIGKPYVMGVFEHSEKFFARRCAVMLCSMSRVLRTLLRPHAVLPAQARTCLMLQKHWFFYHAVVIPMQCSRSPRARTTSPLTHG